MVSLPLYYLYKRFQMIVLSQEEEALDQKLSTLKEMSRLDPHYFLNLYQS